MGKFLEEELEWGKWETSAGQEHLDCLGMLIPQFFFCSGDYSDCLFDGLLLLPDP